MTSFLRADSSDILVIIILMVILVVAIFLRTLRRRHSALTGQGPSAQRVPQRLPLVVFYKSGRLKYVGTVSIAVVLILIYAYGGDISGWESELVHELQTRGTIGRELAVIDEFCARDEGRGRPFCADSLKFRQMTDADLKSGRAISVETYDQLGELSNDTRKAILENPALGSSLKTLELLLSTRPADEKESIWAIQKRHNVLTGSNINFFSMEKAQFTHASWSHVLNNAAVLVFFGVVIESWLGTVLYLGIYLMLGLLSTWIYAHFYLPPHQEVLGASLNVSAIMGIYAVFRLGVWPRWEEAMYGLRMARSSMVAEAVWTMYFLFGDDLRGAMNHADEQIAYGGHLVGAVVGLFAGFLLARVFRNFNSVS